MRKTLSPVGSSLGLLIDKPILEALGIDRHTVLELTIEDAAIVIRPQKARSISSRDQIEEWARSLVVRLSASPDKSPDLVAEVERLEEALTLFLPDRPRSSPASVTLDDLRKRTRQTLQELLATKASPSPPIFTRQVSLAILEELAAARGSYLEITAARRFAGADSSVVASVLWFLIARGYLEVHPESTAIRPALERYRKQGAIPENLPAMLSESLTQGMTLLRLSPAGGEYLYQLRASEGASV